MDFGSNYDSYQYNEYFKTELPEHWLEKRLGYISKQDRVAFVDGPFGSDLKSSDYKDYGVPLIQLNNIRNSKHLLQNMKFITEIKKCELIRHVAKPGDVIIAKMADPVARSAVVSDIFSEYVIVADCVKLTPNLDLIDLSYLVWAINSDHVRINAELVSTGTTRIRINLSELKKLKIPYPPKNEQKFIANFLDHETTKIDTLIEKQQQLIKLLKEKRQAVINHAVTKGLSSLKGSQCPMRDSGVEWLGEVPEHWSSPKIKWFFQTESGGTPNTSKYEEYYQDGEIPWIRTTDLNNNDLFETPVAISEQAVKDSACSLLPINSVLIAMYGGAGSIGKHSLLKFKSTINQAVCAILPNEKIDADLLHLYVEFYRPYWMVGAEGTRKDPNINQDVIRELIVPCPPANEQLEIKLVTKKKLSIIDEVINKSESNIALMQERRTALISAAVTGKIDVRNWVAPAHPCARDISASMHVTTPEPKHSN